MLTKLVRIGRNAEIRHLPNGTAVMNFPAVYDIGFGDNKKAQWIDCAMFGDRVENVAAHIVKGKQIVIYADDVGIDVWDKADGSGQGFKLKCKLVSFDFVSDGNRPQDNASAQPASRPAPQQANAQADAQRSSQPAPMSDHYGDLDIPF